MDTRYPFHLLADTDPELDLPVVRDADLLADLRDIESRDPDGGSVEPTPAAHAEHERWAVERYGREVWTLYRRGGWDPSNDQDW